MDAEGRVYFPAKKTQRLQRKRYLMNSDEGETVDTLWDDISPIKFACLKSGSATRPKSHWSC